RLLRADLLASGDWPRRPDWASPDDRANGGADAARGAATKPGRRTPSSAVRASWRMAKGALGQTMATALAVQVGLFLTGPLVARMLGVEGRGHLAALVLWPTTIATIATWGVPTALTYERAASGALPSALLRRVSLVACV